MHLPGYVLCDLGLTQRLESLRQTKHRINKGVHVLLITFLIQTLRFENDSDHYPLVAFDHRQLVQQKETLVPQAFALGSILLLVEDAIETLGDVG